MVTALDVGLGVGASVVVGFEVGADVARQRFLVMHLHMTMAAYLIIDLSTPIASGKWAAIAASSIWCSQRNDPNTAHGSA
jgi:hypothetical protein